MTAWSSSRSPRRVGGAVLAAVALLAPSACGVSHPTSTTTTARAARGSTRAASSRGPVDAARRPSCFASPRSCGFPDPRSGTIGAGDCSALRPFSPSDLPAGDYNDANGGNTVAITADHVTIQGYDIGNWQIYGDGASDLTLNRDCVSYDGGANDSSTAVWTTGSGLTVENSTLIAPGCSTSPITVCTSAGVDESMIGGGPDTRVDNDILAGAVEPINGLGPGSRIDNNYILANGDVGDAHSEDIYEANIAGITINHNTLLNPMDQSAVIYGDVPEVNGAAVPCVNRFTITDNLMAGGGYILLSCAQASGPGSSSLIFVANDVARCHGTANFDGSLGGHQCGGAAPSTTAGTAIGSGVDVNGYWPRGGFFGLTDDVYCPPTAHVIWQANEWDDNGKTIRCQ